MKSLFIVFLLFSQTSFAKSMVCMTELTDSFNQPIIVMTSKIKYLAPSHLSGKTIVSLERSESLYVKESIAEVDQKIKKCGYKICSVTLTDSTNNDSIILMVSKINSLSKSLVGGISVIVLENESLTVKEKVEDIKKNLQTSCSEK